MTGAPSIADAGLWHATAGPDVGAAPLTEAATTDLVIIGGGFTGCSAALQAAQAGASVRLLEAAEIGHGGSGRNVGLVNAGLWTPPDQVEALLGAAEGQRLNAALAGGPDLVFDLIARHGIACEATRTGTLHLAHARSGIADLRRRHAQQVARGAPVTLLDAEETAARTGAVGLHGALHDARAGTIHPLAYVRGLARAAMAAGAVLHEASPVTAVAHDGACWQVHTRTGGRVRARVLIEATNAYARTPRPGGAAWTPVTYFQFATRPLGHNLRRTILPGGEGCWDTATVMSSVRTDAAGRLIIGSIGSLEHGGRMLRRDWARRKLAALFPDAADTPFDHCWAGRIAMTGDHLPKIERRGPRGLSIFGYSGRGIGPGTVFGTAAARWAVTGDEAALPVPIQMAPRDRWAGLKRLYYEAGAALTQVAGPR